MAIWQRMLSGRRLDLLDPSALDVEIEDIAHGLARVARWNGRTAGTWPLSVAEHSLLVERIAGMLEPTLGAGGRLAALLHDGHEYAVGDMISPLKDASGPDRLALEERLQVVIHIRFGLPAEVANEIRLLIRRADCAAAHLEAIQLGEYASHEAQKLWGNLTVDGGAFKSRRRANVGLERASRALTMSKCSCPPWWPGFGGTRENRVPDRLENVA